MVTCAICGDTNGPWIYEEGIGFVCEDCEENGNLEAEQKKRLDQDEA